jgi:hypothetical protein
MHTSSRPLVGVAKRDFARIKLLGLLRRKVIAGIIAIGLTACALIVVAVFEYVEMRTIVQARPDDTLMTSVITVSSGRGKHRGEVVIDFVNPSPSPVLVGLSVRTEFWTGWFRVRQSARVISRPDRRHRVTAQSAIGVIPANGSSRMPVRIPSGRRCCRAVAIAGEADGRLREMSVRVPVRSSVPVKLPVKADRAAVTMFEGLFYWFY